MCSINRHSRAINQNVLIFVRLVSFANRRVGGEDHVVRRVVDVEVAQHAMARALDRVGARTGGLRVRMRIAEEAARRKPPPATDKPRPAPAPPRESRTVRFTDVATVTRVTSITEWDQLRDRLDKRVRELLEHHDVELG